MLTSFFLPSLLTFGHCDFAALHFSAHLAFLFAFNSIALFCHAVKLSSKWNYLCVASIVCSLLTSQDWQALLYTKAPLTWRLISKQKAKFPFRAAGFTGSLLIHSAPFSSAVYILPVRELSSLVGALICWGLLQLPVCVHVQQKLRASRILELVLTENFCRRFEKPRAC